MPKVSVIMNCYNGDEFVRGAIESVYAQTYQDWEIIFWDNCSTDTTPDIAQSFNEKLRYFRSETNTPLGTARNMAMAQARGEWIAFLDHDDLCLPHRFERQVAAVEGKDYALCYAGMQEMDEHGRLVREVLPQHTSGNIFGELLADCDAFLQTTMVNRVYMQRYNIETAPFYMLFEDVNLFLKLAARGPVCVLPEVVSVWRLLPTSLSETKKDRFAMEYFHLLDDLRQSNPGIEDRYPEAFRQAQARGVYYQARRDMEIENIAVGRDAMRGIAGVRKIYGILYMLSFWPWLWNLAHNRTWKAKLTNLFLGRGKAASKGDV
jgi:glycosyltransferase involved in cell wall biosynthesis